VDPRTAIEALAEALKTDKSADVREAAATALGEVARVRTDLRAAVPGLTAAVKDDEPAVRAAAAQTLGRLGNDATPAGPARVGLLQDRQGDRFARSRAALGPGKVGGADTRVLAALAEVLGDAEAPKGVREDAARGLGQLRERAAPATAALARLLQDRDVELRRAAAGALGQIGPGAKDALPLLKAA